MGFQNRNMIKYKAIKSMDDAKDLTGVQVLNPDFDGKILIQHLVPLQHKDIEDLEVGDLQIKFPKWNRSMVDRNQNKFRPLEIHLFQGTDKNGKNQFHVTAMFIKQVNVPDQVQVPDPESPADDIQMITKSVTTPKLVGNIAPDYENRDYVPPTTAAAGSPSSSPSTPGAAEPQG